MVNNISFAPAQAFSYVAPLVRFTPFFVIGAAITAIALAILFLWKKHTRVKNDTHNHAPSNDDVHLDDKNNPNAKTFNVLWVQEGQFTIPAKNIQGILKDTLKKKDVVIEFNQPSNVDLAIFPRNYTERPTWAELDVVVEDLNKKLPPNSNITREKTCFIYLQLFKDQSIGAQPQITWTEIPKDTFHVVGTEDGLNMETDWCKKQVNSIVNYIIHVFGTVPTS